MGLLDFLVDRAIRRKPAPFSTQGTGGTFAYGGYLFTSEKNTDLASAHKRLKKFDEISLNVAIVATGLRYYSALLSGINWTLEPPEEGGAKAEKLAKIVERNMDAMDVPFYRVVRRMGQFKWIGHSVQEWIAARMDDVEPGYIGIGKVEQRPQGTLEQWDLEEKTGEVLGWLQRDPYTNELFPLSRKKCIYIWDDTLTNSPDGVGLLRHVVKLVTELQRLEQLEGWAFETDLRGIPVGYAPLGLLDELVQKKLLSTEGKTAMLKGMKDFIENHIKNPQLGVMLDSSVYRDMSADKTPSSQKLWGLELLSTNTQGLGELHTAIERKNREIARALGIEQFLLGSDSKGSHALSSDKSANLAQIIQSTVSEIAWTLEHDWLDPIFALNSWDPKLKPKLKPDPVQLRSVAEICENLANLAKAGLMPNDPAINQIRSMMDLVDAPEVDEELMGVLTGAVKPMDPNIPRDPKTGQPVKPHDPNIPRDPKTGQPMPRGGAGADEGTKRQEQRRDLESKK